MLGVGRLVGAGNAMVVHNGAEDLTGLDNHLDAMFVAVHLGGDTGIGVKDEYVHTFIIPSFRCECTTKLPNSKMRDLTMFNTFASFLLFAAISPQKKTTLAQKYGLTEDQVEEFSKLDPTNNAAYTDWLCRESKSGEIDESVTDVLKQFNKLKNSPTFEGSKNIFDYDVTKIKSLFQRKIRHQLKDMSKKEIETKLKAEGLPGGKLILNNGTWKIWKVSNPEYAMILGTGTGWCTANRNHAVSYCRDAPLYPIYKNDKPFAQGYVGTSSIVLMDAKDHSFESLSPDLRDLLEASEAGGFPEFKYMVHGVLSRLKTITKKDSEFFKKLIIDNDHYGVLQVYLSKLYWPEGWEMLLDTGSKDMVSNVLSTISSANGFFSSPYVEEVLDLGLVDGDSLVKLLPYFAKNGKFKEFFLKVQTPVAYEALGAAVKKALVKWISSVIETSDKGDAIKIRILSKIIGADDDLIQNVIIPFWKKFGESKPWPDFEYYLDKSCPEYHKLFGKELTKAPKLRIGDRFTVKYGKYKYSYSIHSSHINNDEGQNRAILNVVLGMRPSATTEGPIYEFLRPLYGYEPSGGDWPTYNYGDNKAVQSVIQALVQRGCKIEKV